MVGDGNDSVHDIDSNDDDYNENWMVKGGSE